MYKIPFNKPYSTGSEINYIKDVIDNEKLSGDGKYTQKCQEIFENILGFKKCLLTTSCTDALELSALLINVKEGDEIIMPSYTFVSTANAFALRGAKIVFCDSRADHPGIDEDSIEELITERTKAIVVVHYAGIATEMDKIMSITSKYKLWLVEDAAQAIDSFYKGRRLGTFGQLAAFSFHETKNIQCGEGGLLVINDNHLIPRAEILREKGTNRTAFFRGEIDKYSWVDVGSSFLPSELNAAYLFAQLESIDKIQIRRKELWEEYYIKLKNLKPYFELPEIPIYATNNAHMFYLICENQLIRHELIQHLKSKGIMAVFHYISLHQSPFFKNKYHGKDLSNSERYTNCLLRLPLYFGLEKKEIHRITSEINTFCKSYE
jgi:dTDP-4-amino-4,6-dideoxygalactose transaminase